LYPLLTDISLIEVSSFVASPTAGLYLAQMGAEVIRVDQIGGGQDFRRWPVTEANDSLSWENINRAKKSVALDLTSKDGRALLTDLIVKTGILVTNLPATGFLGHDRLAAVRPDLITVRIMGWPDGAVALDYTANAVVGYPALTGLGDDPVNHVLPAWDLLTGAYAAFALLAALRRRDQTGEGAEIRLPLTDIAMGSAANMGRVAEVIHSGKDRERIGNAVFGTIGRDFVTQDGVRIMIVAINERQWNGLVKALSMADDVAAIEQRHSANFTNNDGARYTHRAEIFALIERAIAAHDHAVVAGMLDAENVVHGLYQTMVKAVTDPRLVTHNPMFASVADNPSGLTYPAPGSFATIPQLDREPPRTAPVMGADTQAVLTERLGLDAEALAALAKAGTL
jgi:2-methylfumaryl-CoA isomerase